MVRQSLNTDSAKAVVHALIATRLDYCNSVLYRINTSTVETWQSVLHSTAQLIMWKRKFDSITPTLRDDVHWLPVSQRIVYKLCIITASDCAEVPSRAVHSSHSHCQSSSLALSCSWRPTSAGNKNCHHHRPCSFAASAPELWNSLPPALRDSTLTLTQFSSRLKTHLFCLVHGRAS